MLPRFARPRPTFCVPFGQACGTVPGYNTRGSDLDGPGSSLEGEFEGSFFFGGEWTGVMLGADELEEAFGVDGDDNGRRDGEASFENISIISID